MAQHASCIYLVIIRIKRLTPHDGLNKRVRSVPIFSYVGMTNNVTGLNDIKPRPCIEHLSLFPALHACTAQAGPPPKEEGEARAVRANDVHPKCVREEEGNGLGSE